MNNLRQQIEKRVAKWFGEPVIAVEDEIMDLIQAHDTERTEALLAALPKDRPRRKVTNELDSIADYTDQGYNTCLAKVRQIIEKGGE